jgi:hypothetical protein
MKGAGTLGGRAVPRRHRGLALAAAFAVLFAAVGLAGRPPAAVAQDENPLLEFLQAAAAANGKSVEVDGDIVRVDDPAGDQVGAKGCTLRSSEPGTGGRSARLGEAPPERRPGRRRSRPAAPRATSR